MRALKKGGLRPASCLRREVKLRNNRLESDYGILGFSRFPLSNGRLLLREFARAYFQLRPGDTDGKGVTGAVRKGVLLCGGRKQEPYPRDSGRLNATPERGRILGPSGRGECQTVNNVDRMAAIRKREDYSEHPDISPFLNLIRTARFARRCEKK